MSQSSPKHDVRPTEDELHALEQRLTAAAPEPSHALDARIMAILAKAEAQLPPRRPRRLWLSWSIAGMAAAAALMAAFLPFGQAPVESGTAPTQIARVPAAPYATPMRADAAPDGFVLVGTTPLARHTAPGARFLAADRTPMQVYRETSIEDRLYRHPDTGDEVLVRTSVPGWSIHHALCD